MSEIPEDLRHRPVVAVENHFEVEVKQVAENEWVATLITAEPDHFSRLVGLSAVGRTDDEADENLRAALNEQMIRIVQENQEIVRREDAAQRN